MARRQFSDSLERFFLKQAFMAGSSESRSPQRFSASPVQYFRSSALPPSDGALLEAANAKLKDMTMKLIGRMILIIPHR